MSNLRKYIRKYNAVGDLPTVVDDGSLANVNGVLYKKAAGAWSALTLVPAGSLALALQTAVELTLDTNGDAVKTADEGNFTIDTFEDAASDTLRKLTGGSAGDVIWIHPASDARTVIIEHDATTADEFRCPDGENITLAEDTDWAQCVHDGTGWVVVNFSTLASSKKAAKVTVLDSAALFDATDVEAALLELIKKVPVALADPGTGAAIPVTRSATVLITTGGSGETNTLADPTFAGQQMILSHVVDGGGNRVVTAASDVTATPGENVMTFGDAGDYIVLVAVPVAAGALKWRAVLNSGVALS